MHKCCSSYYSTQALSVGVVKEVSLLLVSLNICCCFLLLFIVVIATLFALSKKKVEFLDVVIVACCYNPDYLSCYYLLDFLGVRVTRVYYYYYYYCFLVEPFVTYFGFALSLANTDEFISLCDGRLYLG